MDYLAHYGVKGMKWKHHKYANDRQAEYAQEVRANRFKNLINAAKGKRYGVSTKESRAKFAESRSNSAQQIKDKIALNKRIYENQKKNENYNKNPNEKYYDYLKKNRGSYAAVSARVEDKLNRIKGYDTRHYGYSVGKNRTELTKRDSSPSQESTSSNTDKKSNVTIVKNRNKKSSNGIANKFKTAINNAKNNLSLASQNSDTIKKEIKKKQFENKIDRTKKLWTSDKSLSTKIDETAKGIKRDAKKRKIKNIWSGKGSVADKIDKTVSTLRR